MYDNLGKKNSMKITKKIIFYPIIALSIKVFGFNEHMLTSKNIANGMTQSSNIILSKAIVDQSQKAGVDAVKATAKASKNMSNNLAEGMVKSSVTLDSEGIEKLVPVVVGLLAVKEIVYAGKDLYTYVYPDKEKLASISAAKETIDLIETKRAFRSCLMQNAKAPRNAAGIPINCEECGKTFSMTAGTGAFHYMVETFKETY